MSEKRKEIEQVASNRKAMHNYEILETIEAGINLEGPEVKSLRLKQASMDGSFAVATKEEVFVHNLHISPYSFNKTSVINPLRTRKLLLKKREIKKLNSQTTIKGNTLIPLEIYFKHGWAKIKLALAKGKNTIDKRDTLRKKDVSRELSRDFKNKYKV